MQLYSENQRTMILVLSASLQTFTDFIQIGVPLLLLSSFNQLHFNQNQWNCLYNFGAHHTSPPIMHNIRQNQIIGKENNLNEKIFENQFALHVWEFTSYNKHDQPSIIYWPK